MLYEWNPLDIAAGPLQTVDVSCVGDGCTDECASTRSVEYSPEGNEIVTGEMGMLVKVFDAQNLSTTTSSMSEKQFRGLASSKDQQGEVVMVAWNPRSGRNKGYTTHWATLYQKQIAAQLSQKRWAAAPFPSVGLLLAHGQARAVG